MTIWKKFFVFLVLSCFLFATVFSVSGCGGLASLVTTAASTSLGGMEAWVFVPGVGAKNASHTSKVTPPSGFIALPGATLTIVGTGYSAVTDSSGYASITGLANGTYTVTVAKEGYKTYSYTVTVATGVDTQVGGSGGIETEVSTAPGIMNLSATSGAIGSSVTITGVNFGSTQGTSQVSFTGADATDITSWSSTQIVCKVPNGAETGGLAVVANSVKSNVITFTVSGAGAPVIDSLSPESGGEGVGVTITGSNFGSSQGSTVTFNGTLATPTLWSDTTIYTTVPSGATTGDVIVTVGGVASNKVSFGVLTWHAVDFTPSQAVNAVYGTSNGSTIYFACNNYRIVRYIAASNSWTEIDPGIKDAAWHGVWCTSDGATVFVAGDGGKIYQSTTGGSSWTDSISGTTEQLNGIWGSSINQIFAVGNAKDGAATLRYYDGKGWENKVSTATLNLYSIWGSSSSNIYAVGQGGTIVKYTDAWGPIDSGTGYNLLGVWGSSSTDVFAISQNDGVIRHYDGKGWSSMTQTATIEQLNGVWGSSGSDVFVVGTKGTILHYDGKGWSTMTSPTKENLRSVWGSSSSDVYAVGENGTILHYGTE